MRVWGSSIYGAVGQLSSSLGKSGAACLKRCTPSLEVTPYLRFVRKTKVEQSDLREAVLQFIIASLGRKKLKVESPVSEMDGRCLKPGTEGIT